MGLRDPGGVIVHELGEKHKLYFLLLFQARLPRIAVISVSALFLGLLCFAVGLLFSSGLMRLQDFGHE